MSEKDDDYKKWLEAMAKDSGVKIAQSSIVCGLMTGNSVSDAHQALQLGFALMMDKPIFLIVDKEVKLSQSLTRLAHGATVRIDINNPEEMEKAQKQLAEFIKNKGAN